MTGGSFQDRVGEYIRTHALIPKGAPVLVAVSAGIDSMVAAHVLRSLGYGIALVHVNHGLRPEGAVIEADFVGAVGEKWGLRVIRLDISAELDAPHVSIQAAAREARYRVLRETAEAEQIGFVAVGHQRDDQAETVIQHLIRGTGVAGLAGMPSTRLLDPDAPVRLVRPLLAESRTAIHEYALAEGVEWIEDPSNRSDAYQRNRIRAHVLPALREASKGDPADAIARSAELIRVYDETDVSVVAQALIDASYRPVLGSGGMLHESGLAPLPRVWRSRVYLRALQMWLPEARRDRELLDRIDGLRVSQPGRRIDCAGGAVWREREGLGFVASAPIPSSEQLPLDQEVVMGGWAVRRHKGPPAYHGMAGGSWALLTLGEDDGPWAIRPWQAGDRLVPAGGSGESKIKDMLTDARIPAHGRRSHPVVTAGGRLVWVVGLRVDEEAAARDGRVIQTYLTAFPVR